MLVKSLLTFVVPTPTGMVVANVGDVVDLPEADAAEQIELGRAEATDEPVEAFDDEPDAPAPLDAPATDAAPAKAKPGPKPKAKPAPLDAPAA